VVAAATSRPSEERQQRSALLASHGPLQFTSEQCGSASQSGSVRRKQWHTNLKNALIPPREEDSCMTLVKPDGVDKAFGGCFGAGDALGDADAAVGVAS
jgi:hypothetical protein